MEESELIRQAMSALGKRKSEKKRLSSIANAKKPRKRSNGNARTKKTVCPIDNGLDATVKNN